VSALAARQYGVVGRDQLLGLELSRHAIRRRLEAGRLIRVHQGVYAVGHAAPRPEARWMAAVLACGPGAVLSHRSAASLWRIREAEGPRPDVTAAALRRHPGVDAHRAALLPSDMTVRLGIPVTTAERTLADLAHAVDADEVIRALREAQHRRLVSFAALRRVLARRPSVVLAAELPAAMPTESELEDALVALCDRHGIPRPVAQHRIGARDVDFAWPDRRVALEVDSWEAHGTRMAFQADRSATNALQLAGWIALRVTYEDLTRRHARTARIILAALDR
jgi:very-short-patch-repair endonuclease